MLGDQGLVGGDDRLAGPERRLDRRLGRAIRAADQLDENVGLVRLGQGDGVVEPGRFEMSKGRGLERERAETPVTAVRPPAGAKSGRSERKLSRPAPTVPRPATPTRQVF
jgi:hypothetical protein